jgi:hypothetical protein
MGSVQAEDRFMGTDEALMALPLILTAQPVNQKSYLPVKQAHSWQIPSMGNPPLKSFLTF